MLISAARWRVAETGGATEEERRCEIRRDCSLIREGVWFDSISRFSTETRPRVQSKMQSRLIVSFWCRVPTTNYERAGACHNSRTFVLEDEAADSARVYCDKSNPRADLLVVRPQNLVVYRSPMIDDKSWHTIGMGHGPAGGALLFSRIVSLHSGESRGAGDHFCTARSAAKYADIHIRMCVSESRSLATILFARRLHLSDVPYADAENASGWITRRGWRRAIKVRLARKSAMNRG